MRAGVNALIAVCVAATVHAVPQLALADPETSAQWGERRWVPSFAFTSGVLIQRQSASHTSLLFDEGSPVPIPLRTPKRGQDRVLTPFVGAMIELMTPAIPMPTRPRLFVSGEVIPLFPAERQITIDGQPKRIRGAELNTVLAVDENSVRYTEPPNGPRPFEFGENEASGQGSRTRAALEDLAWGARVGVSFPFEIAGRQARIKPSFGWIRYGVEATGVVVDPSCNPTFQCTNTYNQDGSLIAQGFLRESIMSASAKDTFDGYGPGVDVEMDTGRYGPLGISLFLGFHGYYIFGNRQLEYGANAAYNDELGNDLHSAQWKVTVNPWLFRASLGMRFQWLGGAR